MDLLIKPTLDYKSNCFELNTDLYNLMDMMNHRSPDWASVHKLSDSTSNYLSTNFEVRTRLMRTSLLCVLPIFTSKLEWETLFTGDVTKLTNSFSLAPSAITASQALEIKHLNRDYLRHLISTARTSPLAMMELGVPMETIELLRTVTVEQRNNAIAFKLPMFKWRYTDIDFSTIGKSTLGETDILNHLIKTIPTNLMSLSSVSNVAQRYHSEAAYPLAEHLVTYNMRASIITMLLPNLHSAKIREMYLRLTSFSSACGKLPSSYAWYFTTERRRTHSSLLLLMYRIAMQSGLAHIHSIIASYGWYLSIAPEEPISIDRHALLVNTVQTGGGMVYVASCRTCAANHLLCNTDEKQEFAHNFSCELCRRKKQLAA